MIRRCACGSRIKHAGDTACWECRVLTGVCRSCLNPHNDINPATGRKFTRCDPCRTRFNELAASLKGRDPLRKKKIEPVHHVSTRREVQHDAVESRFRWATVLAR